MMTRRYLIRRVEELTNQVEALRKDNADLRVQVADATAHANEMAEKWRDAEQRVNRLDAERKDLEAELLTKYQKIGRLIADNGRLLVINANICKWRGVKPARRLVDDNGDAIPREEAKP